MFLDLSFTICVRGATDFQNFEDVPSETARLLKDGSTKVRFGEGVSGETAILSERSSKSLEIHCVFECSKRKC